MHFFNIEELISLSEGDDYALILLVYAALNRGYKINSKSSLFRTLGITNYKVPYKIWDICFNWNKESILKTNMPYGFVNIESLYANIDVRTKAAYIKTATLLTNEQRWAFKKWGKPLLLSTEYMPHYTPDIPKTWIADYNPTQKRLQLEEKYYG